MSLLARVLAVALTGPQVAPDEGPTVAVVPLGVEGQLPARMVDRASVRMTDALRRGAVVVAPTPAPSPPCPDAACWAGVAHEAGAQYLLAPRLEISDDQRSYAFQGRVLDHEGREAFVLEARCELCGFEEAIGLVEDRVATTAERIERLAAQPARLAVTGTPVGATVSVDATAIGTMPLDEEVEPGLREVEVTHEGFSPQSFTMDFVPGARRSFEVDLIARPVSIDQSQRRRARVMFASGAVLAGVSLAAVIAGSVLVGLHGRPYRDRCEADIEGNCRFLYGTRGAGVGALVSGGVGVAVAVPLMVLGRRRARDAGGR